METPPQHAILEAAATIFAEFGFAGARVEAIARAAGINKAMLYYRVGDKARLYELVVLRQFERVAQAVETAAGESEPVMERGADASPPAALLGRILSSMADLFSADPRLPRIMAWELASGGANLPGSVMALWGRILGAVAPVAARAGFDPGPAYFSMVGSMILFSLTAPLRQRAASSLPSSLASLGQAGVHDMAAFLTALFTRAAENTP